MRLKAVEDNRDMILSNMEAQMQNMAKVHHECVGLVLWKRELTSERKWTGQFDVDDLRHRKPLSKSGCLLDLCTANPAIHLRVQLFEQDDKPSIVSPKAV
ncbi:hypothetical protein PMIN06_005579 [Paraphaeosphaeria minitans]